MLESAGIVPLLLRGPWSVPCLCLVPDTEGVVMWVSEPQSEIVHAWSEYGSWCRSWFHWAILPRRLNGRPQMQNQDFRYVELGTLDPI